MTDNTNLVEAVRRLVKAKGRYHTEQNYKAVVDALDSYDAARRASPKESEGQRQSGLPGALKTPETRMDTGFEGGHLASARSEGLELPPLPEPKYAADDLTDIFTADQVQQYAREAVEADRRARAVAHISEMAQWARDNGLNVPVEWSSRAQQPAPAASIDMPEFRRLFFAAKHAEWNFDGSTPALAALIAHIDAKLAEARRETGQQEDA